MDGNTFDDYPRAHAPTININGDMNFTLPKGTTQQQGQALLQWIISQGGTINTGPTLPTVLTAGGLHSHT